jgi:AhpD family alkylhydroperoxidase
VYDFYQKGALPCWIGLNTKQNYWRLSRIRQAGARFLKGYLTLTNAHSKDSLLGEKVRQLISLAVAVTTRCDGCISIHTDAALKAGAIKEEIAETLGVAMAMNAGAAFVYSMRTMDAVHAYTTPK